MIKKEKLKANWQLFERRPTWSVVTSAELAQVLGVHPQVISNWTLRKIIPPPINNHKLRGNKNRFRISAIKAWLENRSEHEIHMSWAKTHIPYDFETLEQAEYIVNHAYLLLNVEKSPIPAHVLN